MKVSSRQSSESNYKKNGGLHKALEEILPYEKLIIITRDINYETLIKQYDIGTPKRFEVTEQNSDKLSQTVYEQLKPKPWRKTL